MVKLKIGVSNCPSKRMLLFLATACAPTSPIRRLETIFVTYANLTSIASSSFWTLAGMSGEVGKGSIGL